MISAVSLSAPISQVERQPRQGINSAREAIGNGVPVAGLSRAPTSRGRQGGGQTGGGGEPRRHRKKGRGEAAVCGRWSSPGVLGPGGARGRAGPAAVDGAKQRTVLCSAALRRRVVSDDRRLSGGCCGGAVRRCVTAGSTPPPAAAEARRCAPKPSPSPRGRGRRHGPGAGWKLGGSSTSAEQSAVGILTAGTLRTPPSVTAHRPGALVAVPVRM